ncbi:hypothetical protein BCR41DRAFT_360063 [Lobosporangium transversale]|uniref:Retrotransposon gag domain-containing protein n=1 Tax=Lobosporangium transversale TaxID=64571 RepID=A0A1Y2GD04_9FUNG|nr:hypothetical protein BCR41DRAFT_360063 [Lobosporangium transversale]ORZ07476.1 hypothetical protein BCR41DRAFT_360063 [Lobosporangium transversale]|eukprot:XP_021877983.1 hypothetical protein BCR41DRAFT_360063 [Lobosporangium transversale]
MREMKKHEAHELTWEKCEILFLSTSLNEQERTTEMKQMLETGRKRTETFQQFAIRFSKEVRVYGIKDDNEMVLGLLTSAIDSETHNVMVSRLYTLKGRMVKKFISIRDFVKILSDLSGPTSALRAQKEQKSPQDSTTVGPLRSKNNRNNRFSAYKKSSIKESTRSAPDSYQCSRCGVNNTHKRNNVFVIGII